MPPLSAAAYSDQGLREIYASFEAVIARRLVDGLVCKFSSHQNMSDEEAIGESLRHILQQAVPQAERAELVSSEHDWLMDSERRWAGRACHQVKLTFSQVSSSMRCCRDLGRWTEKQLEFRHFLLQALAGVATFAQVTDLKSDYLEPKAECTCNDVWGTAQLMPNIRVDSSGNVAKASCRPAKPRRNRKRIHRITALSNSAADEAYKEASTLSLRRLCY